MQSNVINLFKAQAQSFEAIDIIKQAWFVLERIDGQKLTEKGFFPRALVTEFWRHMPLRDKAFRPYREADCMELHRLHFLLNESGCLRRRAGRVWLTKEAKRVLETRNGRELYRALFMTMVARYDWGYDDRYPEYPEIQGVSVDMLEFLLDRESITPAELFCEFFKPAQIDETKFTYDELEEIKFITSSPIRCLQLRFFERFCLPFGLLESSREGEGLGEITDTYRVTEFLEARLLDILKDD